MRVLVLFLLLPVILTCSVLALDCQYKVNETYEEFEEALVIENTLIKRADALKITDFTSGEQSTFTAHNPNDFEIFAKFIYAVSGHGAGEAEKGLRIPPKSYAVLKHYCFDGNALGDCSITPESVTYFVVSLLLDQKSYSPEKSKS